MTTLEARTPTTTVSRAGRAGHALLVAGGVGFFAGGPLHPQGSDEGDKIQQLHSMLVDPAWYPAHMVSALGFVCVAAGLVALRRDPVMRERLGRLLTLSVWVAVAAALGSLVHLLAATQAVDLLTGRMTPLVGLFMGVETVVNPVWGLTVAALAVVGGLTLALGNRIVLALGLVGGAAFALGTATIAFVDTFDPLFPVAGLAGLWLVAAGVIGLLRQRA